MAGSPQEILPVDVSVEELEKVLDQAVKVTANQTLQVLVDLHGQLSGIVRQFVRTPNRSNLPKVGISNTRKENNRCFTIKIKFVFLFLSRNYKRS